MKAAACNGAAATTSLRVCGASVRLTFLNAKHRSGASGPQRCLSLPSFLFWPLRAFLSHEPFAPSVGPSVRSPGSCHLYLREGELRPFPARPQCLLLCRQQVSGKHYSGEGRLESWAGGIPLKTLASRMRSWALEANEFYRSNKLDTI